MFLEEVAYSVSQLCEQRADGPESHFRYAIYGVLYAPGMCSFRICELFSQLMQETMECSLSAMRVSPEELSRIAASFKPSGPSNWSKTSRSAATHPRAANSRRTQ